MREGHQFKFESGHSLEEDSVDAEMCRLGRPGPRVASSWEVQTTPDDVLTSTSITEDSRSLAPRRRLHHPILVSASPGPEPYGDGPNEPSARYPYCSHTATMIHPVHRHPLHRHGLSYPPRLILYPNLDRNKSSLALLFDSASQSMRALSLWQSLS